MWFSWRVSLVFTRRLFTELFFDLPDYEILKVLPLTCWQHAQFHNSKHLVHNERISLANSPGEKSSLFDT